MAKNVVPAKAARLLRRVARHILEEPKRVDMNVWASPSDDPCGTVGCIAGWTVLLGMKKPEATLDIQLNAGTMASDILDLPIYASDQRTQLKRLFFHSRWPDPYRKAFDETSKFSTARAIIIVARIEHFIKTGK